MLGCLAKALEVWASYGQNVILNSIKNRCTNLESNLGKHIGVQLSAALNDSDEFTRLKIRCKSAGWMKYFFMRTNVISWLLASSIANTRFWNEIEWVPTVQIYIINSKLYPYLYTCVTSNFLQKDLKRIFMVEIWVLAHLFPKFAKAGQLYLNFLNTLKFKSSSFKILAFPS